MYNNSQVLVILLAEKVDLYLYKRKSSHIKKCFPLFKSKFRKQGKKEETAESYFLAGRSMQWWAVSKNGT